MFNYITKRLLWMIPTLFGITLVTFFIMKLAPGDPTTLKLMFAKEGLSPQSLAKELDKKDAAVKVPDWYLKTQKNITELFFGKKPFIDAAKKYLEDDHFITKKFLLTKTDRALTWIGKNSVLYCDWVSGILHFNFGYSLKDKRPVIQRIGEALPVTLLLNFITITIVYLISIPLGIWSALNKNSIWDKVVMIKLFILYSLPAFWVATLLLVFLAGGDYLNLFPLRGIISDDIETLPLFTRVMDVAWHLVLPIIVSVYGSFAFLSRFARTNFLEVISQDYIRTAKAKGLSKGKVIWRHAFRNSLIPYVTLMSSLLPALLGGSVIVEQIFSIPGMGMLSFEAIRGRDYPLVMGLATISAALTLINILLADIAYVLVDPRISYADREKARG